MLKHEFLPHTEHILNYTQQMVNSVQRINRCLFQNHAQRIRTQNA